MAKQDADALLVQLYADYSVLCSKCGYTPGNGTAEAVAMATQALQEVECGHWFVKIKHTAILKDTKANCLVYCRLEDVKEK